MKISVIGDGGWGTAIAKILYENNHNVSMWSKFPEYAESIIQNRENIKYLPGIKIPSDIKITADMNKCLYGSELVVIAVPSRYYRSICDELQKSGYDPHNTIFVSVTKGLEKETFYTMTQVLQDVLGDVKVSVISGPSHAEEVARGIPTAVVTASEDKDTAITVQEVFNSERFRVYTSTDLTGVQLGGALKNVIAIAVGISDGMGFGDNTKAALMTRGMAEISRLGMKMGAKRETLAGLAGIGDIIVTCMSPYGRNLKFGRMIGKGIGIKEALESTPMVVEGYYTTESAFNVGCKYNVDMPITQKVYEILYKGKPYEEAVNDLMGRSTKPEWRI